MFPGTEMRGRQNGPDIINYRVNAKVSARKLYNSFLITRYSIQSSPPKLGGGGGGGGITAFNASSDTPATNCQGWGGWGRGMIFEERQICKTYALQLLLTFFKKSFKLMAAF